MRELDQLIEATMTVQDTARTADSTEGGVMDTLTKLIESVEKGGDESPPWRTVLGWDEALMADAAFNGSLDAALSLMEALLPTGQGMIGTHRPRAHVSLSDGFAVTCFSDNPARALLLAVLNAYRSSLISAVLKELEATCNG